MSNLLDGSISVVKVNHHARTSGVSKYGLSRIYKVLLDLLTIKTIVSFASRPLVWFGMLGGVAGLASCIALMYAMYLITAQSAGSPTMAMGVSVLFGSLAIFLLLSGVLCELLYKTGNQKIEDLSGLNKKVIQSGKN